MEFLHEIKKRIYCVGTAKSGTHSINSIFAKYVKSMHEPENDHLIKAILDFSQNKIDQQGMIEIIKERDNKLDLIVDSSQLNFFILDFLLNEFTEAKFILTIRDCYSWLDSFINHSLAYPVKDKWHKLRELRFGTNNIYPEEEKILKDLNLYTLESYFSYWSNHNQKVISIVPEQKLLILRTDQISKSVNLLSEFSGIDLINIDENETHVYKNNNKFNILKEFDRSYIEEKAKKYCSKIMEQYFFEIHTINDAIN